MDIFLILLSLFGILLCLCFLIVFIKHAIHILINFGSDEWGFYLCLFLIFHLILIILFFFNNIFKYDYKIINNGNSNYIIEIKEGK